MHTLGSKSTEMGSRRGLTSFLGRSSEKWRANLTIFPSDTGVIRDWRSHDLPDFIGSDISNSFEKQGFPWAASAWVTTMPGTLVGTRITIVFS